VHAARFPLLTGSMSVRSSRGRAPRWRALLVAAAFASCALVVAGCDDDDECELGPCYCQGGDECFFECEDHGCAHECTQMQRCGAVCEDDCGLTCSDVDSCTASCGDRCRLDCERMKDCGALCGADCLVTCSSVDRCSARVGPNSLVDCTGPLAVYGGVRRPVPGALRGRGDLLGAMRRQRSGRRVRRDAARLRRVLIR
jgi:hypothetical protein